MSMEGGPKTIKIKEKTLEAKLSVVENNAPEIVTSSVGEPVLKIADPHAGLTDVQRMEEYSVTGSPEYLTPELALEMGVGQDIMKRVPDATDAHIFASRSEESFVEEMRVHGDSVLQKYGADTETLEKIPLPEQVRRLMDVAGVRVVDQYDDETERARDIAQENLYALLLEQAGSVYQLFEEVCFSGPESLRDIALIETLYRMARTDFVLLSHTPSDELSEDEKRRGHNAAQVLNEFVGVAAAFVQGDFLPQTNYLFAERARAFAYEIGGLSERMDFDNLAPFEITNGRLAVMSDDGNRVYVADRALSKEVGGVLKNVAPVWREETGQYFARFYREHIPEDMHDAVNTMFDAGVPLDEVIKEFGMQDKELIYDYIAMLQSPSRNVIEDDFTVGLSTLTIREQFYFLQYLKEVTIEDADSMKKFCRTFGLNGLRTFLVTQQDSALREKVFEFTRTATPEQAQAVFASYSKLIESIDGVGDYLRESFAKEDTGAVGEVVERQLARARTLLAQAHTYQNNPEQLTRLADSVRADTQLFVDACRVLKMRGELDLENIKDGSLESVAGGALEGVDADQMRTIWNERYAGKYSPPLEEKLRSEFESAIANPHARFYIYKQNGKVLSFFRVDETEINAEQTPRKHLASLMTDEQYAGGKLGEALFESTLAREQKGAILTGECDPDIGITEKYLEMGFVGVRYYLDQNEPTFAIERREDTFDTQALSKEEIRTRADRGEKGFYQGETPPDFSALLTPPHVLTRYFKERDGTGNTTYYACFEESGASPDTATSA